MDFIQQGNFQYLLLSALIPVVLGFIWYHPNVFGNRVANNAAQPVSQIGLMGNFKRIIWIYLFSMLLSYVILLLSVHQFGPHLLFFGESQMSDPNYGAHAFLANFMEQYGDRHRSFGHGVIHGAELGLFMGIALIGSTALMEGRTIKSMWLHIFFWLICMALMGGVLAAGF